MLSSKIFKPYISFWVRLLHNRLFSFPIHFRLASIKVINVIIPFFFYSKGDQKDSHKRVPITAKLVADLLRKAGASHVMIIEPHTPQLEGFFGTPVDALKVPFLVQIFVDSATLFYFHWIYEAFMQAFKN